ncbi:MAG: hypothetical protein IKU65_05265, partial [Oscillospiraceae bacterium]|nr:hypothetical protein [Oscillospiraceae bacterium]
GVASLASDKFPIDEVVKNIASSAVLGDRSGYAEQLDLLEKQGVIGNKADIIAFLNTYGNEFSEEIIENFLLNLLE